MDTPLCAFDAAAKNDDGVVPLELINQLQVMIQNPPTQIPYWKTPEEMFKLVQGATIRNPIDNQQILGLLRRLSQVYKFQDNLRIFLTSAQTSGKRKHGEEGKRVGVNLCSKTCCRPGSGTILITTNGTRVENLYSIDDPKYLLFNTKTLHIKNNFISLVGKNHIALCEDCFEALNIDQETDPINEEIEKDPRWEEMGSEQNK